MNNTNLPFKSISAVYIEKVVYKGYGLAHHEEYTILVEHTVPGDLIDVEILFAKKSTLYGKVKRFIKKSAICQNIHCEVSGTCGGCNWVNIEYKHQLKFKNEILKDIYKPFKDRLSLPDIIGSEQVNHYRNKIFQPVQEIKHEAVSGIYARYSHEVVPHKICYLHPPVFDQIIESILQYVKKSKVQIYNEKEHSGCLKHIGIRQSSYTNQIVVTLVTKIRKLPFTKALVQNLTRQFPEISGIIQNIQPAFSNVILGREDIVLFGNPNIKERIAKLDFEIHYQAFFQVNVKQAEVIYTYIKNQLMKSDRIIDAYSGTGSIGLFMADQCKEVDFIEENRHSHLNAQKSANLNHINNVQFHCGKTEEALPFLVQKKRFDCIIFDPPRKGMEASIIYLLNKLNIPKVIYMSCDPATQVRDLFLFEKIGYKIKSVQAFDMFPHTWHIETVAVLERIK